MGLGDEMKRGLPESRERGKRHSFPPRALSQIPEKSGCGHELVESRPAEGLDSKQQGFMNQPYSFSPPSFPRLFQAALTLPGSSA